jgi:O-antigen/teichoic acid export membrane protein
MSILRNSFYTFLGKIAQVISTFGVGIIIARSIGPEGNGFYELFQLIVIFSVTLGTLGIGQANVFVIKRKGYGVTETLSTVLTIGVLWGILLSIIIYLFYTVFPRALPGLPHSALLAGAALIPFSLLDSYLIQGFLVDLRIKTQSALIIVKNLLLLVCVAILLSILGKGKDGIITSLAITYVINVIAIIVYLRKYYKINFSFDFSIFKESLSFGLRNWLGNVFLILNYKLDLFLVNYILSIQDVGYYSIAVVIASSLFLIPSSVGPILYSTWAGQTNKNMDEATPKMTRQVVFITFLCSLVVAILGNALITLLYGANYSVAYLPLLLLLPGVIMMTINYVLFNNFASRGKPIISAVILILALVVNVSFNLILIPRFGIKGASLSSTISYSLSAFASIWIFMKISGSVKIRNLVLITRSDIVEMWNGVKKFTFKAKT